jgi:hypothetical protein
MKTLLACLLVCLLPLAVLADDLPSQQELHDLFKAGQYQPLLQKLSRVLGLKGAAAVAYDQVDLTMLRGETFLQLKQQAKAVEQYQAAWKMLTAANPQNARDPKTADEQKRQIRATLLLFSRSQNLQFTPKHRPTAPEQPAGPFPLTDLEQRKPAFNALRADVQAELEPKVKAAKDAKSLVPVIDVMRSVGDLRALEQLTSGDNKVTDQMIKDMATHASDLMSTEVTKLDGEDAAIDGNAHQTVMTHVPVRTSNGITSSSGGPMQTAYRYKGLSANDKKTLGNNVDSLTKIASISHDFGDLGADAAGFKKIETDATKAAEKANITLNADYSQTFNRPKP